MKARPLKPCRGRACPLRKCCIRYSLYQEHGERGEFLLEAYNYKTNSCKLRQTVKL